MSAAFNNKRSRRNAVPRGFPESLCQAAPANSRANGYTGSTWRSPKLKCANTDSRKYNAGNETHTQKPGTETFFEMHRINPVQEIASTSIGHFSRIVAG